MSLQRSPYRVLSAALGLALAGTLVVAPAQARDAEGEVLERVVAIVNGEALFLSELRKRAAPFLPQVMEAPSEAQRMELVEKLYNDILDLLIDETLIEQEAVELQVHVSPEDVQRAIDNVKRQSGLSEEEFWDAVRAQGFTEKRYRQDVRRQLIRLRVINQKVRARINLTESDVRRRYDEMVREARRQARFRVSHIFLPVPEASATEVAEARAKAEAIRDGLDAQGFDAAAAEHGGGDLGWLSQGDLPESLEEALVELDEGEISSPVRGPSGVHIFFLRDRQEGSEAVPPFEQVQGDLYRRMLDQAMAKQESAYLRELRRSSLISRRL